MKSQRPLQRLQCVLLAPMLAGALAAFLSTPALAASCKLGVLADLPVTMEGRRASVPVKINGKDTKFWLDSGAFFSIMSQAKAAELGLPVDPLPQGFYIVGIGGTAAVQYTKIKSFGLVGQNIKDIDFIVGGSDAGNGLIGRNILGIADTEFDLANGSVKLIQPHDCAKRELAYWAGNKPYLTVPLVPDENPRDHRFRVPVSLNGVRMEAEIDTGAEESMVSRRAAQRAGIDFSGPGVTPARSTGGFGRHFVKSWVATFANVTIGDEQILRTRLDVLDDSAAGGRSLPDMLIGADFVMAHHIYVARGQKLVYFTYTGGKPFHTATESRLPAATAAATDAISAAPPALPPGTKLAEAVAGTPSEPKSADDFARRGNARLSAENLPGALADLSEAIRLSPATAAYYADRANANWRSGNAAAGRGDLDRAIALDSTNGHILQIRARMRLAAKDRIGALADAEAAARVTPPIALESGGVAALFTQLGQPARAIAILNSVIAVHRDDARLGMLLNNRCWARGLANVELDKALADCNQSISRAGAVAMVFDSRALIWLRKANFTQAISDSDAALKLQPRLVWSLYVRGLAKNALGQTTAGKADQAAAQAIDPGISEEAARYGIGAITSPS